MRDERQVPSSGTIRIPLRRYRLASRPAYVDVDGGHLTVRLPSYFGAELWRIPVAEVCIVDRGYEGQVQREVTTGKWLTRPVAIPFLRTTSPLSGTNLELHFRSKQRLPQISFRGALNATVPYVLAKTAAGTWVDGVALRVLDPDSASRALAGAGCDTTRAPSWWIADHREVTTDPVAITNLAKADRSASSMRRAFFAVAVLLFLASRLVGKSSAGFALLGLALLAALLAIWAGARGARRLGLWDPPSPQRDG